MQDRRKFLGTFSLGSAGLAFSARGLLTGPLGFAAENKAIDFNTLTKNLLTDWCDGMIRCQINEPGNPKLHGALKCPACSHIHGRCSDALYPFLRMAHVTGEQTYLDAAINVYEWAENNVSQPDGSWTNDINPKSWRGTTIFGAIALAEALHHHGDVLDEERKKAWTARLDKAAGGYLLRDFKKIDFTNLNYGMTGLYGFNLFGRVLGKQKYFGRSQQFSKRIKEFFTEPNKLIYGEGKPSDNRSERGLLPVDLGYNVEESLNGAVLYALEENDTELLDLLVHSMNGHLEFMLPDGAWDNSWGTRSAKWSYWGSRTSDGCQPAFSLMAGYNPAFGTAAIKNAELLQRCTADGLLHGGPHYVSHGIKPCIHHTFAHAKVMALVQDKINSMPDVDKSQPLPRETAQGVKTFPEIAVWLAAKGPWRGTVSSYDSIYKTKSTDGLQQPTGGSLSVLYHNKVGTLLAGSMARYILVEPLNQQPNPGEDFPLTTRVETFKDGTWYTNLYDLKADVRYTDDGKQVTFDVKTTLQDEDRNVVKGNAATYDIQYLLEDSQVTISAASSTGSISNSPAVLVVPIISPTGEKVRQVSENRVEIEKPGGTVVVEASVPLSIKESKKGRIFNMVPGAEAVPIIAHLPKQAGMKAKCAISVV
ncbi:hypothetical protein [Bythopirellula polymerisocia]|uniref:Uncharacterized protein n=1 Tax=Bythopirellula polymerisocia TaxID=2528003 RepID=A0A5C6CVQ9_9BACT|nr:hypothetical protein [Bythopirellula polymerisocia]TWU28670.1 hypothetical protein Pla144_19620 [Bythopirellula polymerisocia]